MAAVLALLFLNIARGQQRTPVAGLEAHSEYRALVDEEGALVRTADSVSQQISTLRRSLRTDTLSRTATSAAIVRMERQGFEIRSRMASLASRINTIEQEWILENLLSQLPPPREGDPEENGDAAFERHSPNLVYSSYFEHGLPPRQLDELRLAQESEPNLPRLIAEYRENRALMEELVLGYDSTTSRAEADSLKRLFEERTRENAIVEERIGEEWGGIFDSKSYLYNLMADKENRREILARFERGMESLREEQSRWQGVVPIALAEYVLQKRMLTDYEIALAGDLGNVAAADSLRRVAEALPHPDGLAEFSHVRLKERLLLDYSDITVGQARYSADNPIPEVEVWPRGIIYRVLVGSFSAPQSPSVFRGASPLAVLKGDDGRYRYFAGGFPSDSLAGAAVEALRRAGFRSPTAVVWIDGVYLDREAAGNSEKLYRVEISGTDELSDELREVIAAQTTYGEDPGGDADSPDPGRGAGDIVRSEGAFTVTPLDAASAMRLRIALESLKAAYPGMEPKLRIFR